MLKIKLVRIGKKNQPSYRVVVQEARERRNGRVVETLGSYQPLSHPSVVRLEAKRIRYWLEKGAIPTKTVRSLIKKA